MNFVNHYIFTPPVDLSVNTEIGGVSSVLYTPQLLATKLAIDVSRITNFSIIGSDIKCRITGSYVMPEYCWNSNTSIKYYRDNDGLVTLINSSGIDDNGQCYEWYFPNCLSVTKTLGNFSFHNNHPQGVVLYLPRCTDWGGTQGEDGGMFLNIGNNLDAKGFKIYAPIAQQMSNSGSVEGDLAAAIVGGYNTLSFVSNFTAPNPITNLTIETIYATAIKLVDNGTSVNPIDYYENVKVNGVSFPNVPKNKYITGLTPSTSYTIEAVAVDVFYNKSTVATITIATVSSENIPITGLVSYYKLNESSGLMASDSFGNHHLTNTGVVINQSGKLSQSYSSSAAAQKLETTTAIPITGNFTINAWIYRSASCPDYACVFEHQGFSNNRGFGIWLISNQISWIINQNYSHNIAATSIALNTWVMVSVTYDGANVKVYLDSVLKQTSANTVNPNTTTVRRLFYNSNNNANFLGRICEVSLHDFALNQSQITTLNNSGNGITL